MPRKGQGEGKGGGRVAHAAQGARSRKGGGGAALRMPRKGQGKRKGGGGCYAHPRASTTGKATRACAACQHSHAHVRAHVRAHDNAHDSRMRVRTSTRTRILAHVCPCWRP